MSWHFSSDRPVYIQIAERMERAVLCGDYAPGEQLPTVRQLATEIAVNPNTVQHAFAELENNGMVVSKGTLGRFVTEDTAIINTCRNRIAMQVIRRFTQDIAQLSLSAEQAIDMIRSVHKEVTE